MTANVKAKFRVRSERLSKRIRTRKERNREKGVICYECDHTWNTNPGRKGLNCESKKHRLIHNKLKYLYRHRLSRPLTAKESEFIARYTANKVDESKPRLQIAKTKQDVRNAD